jgi:hypothetical protein
LSLTLKVPVLLPVALGEKVTKMEQVAEAAKVFGLIGQFVVLAKSETPVEMPLISKLLVWLFKSTMVFAALVVPTV